MKSRSSGYSSDSEQSKQQDLSILRKSILSSLNGFLEAKRAFENGTEEIRRLLSRECDIMYECKVCRNVFRSLTNFVSHKRVYCREQCNYLNNFDSHRHGFIDQDASTILQNEQEIDTKNSISEEVTKLTTDIKCANNDNTSAKSQINASLPAYSSNNISNEKTCKDLSSIIERLINREHVNRVLKVTDYYDQIHNKLTRDELLKKNHILQLDKIPNSKIAVYQTVKRNDSDDIKTEVNEVHELLMNNKTVLGPDGKIIANTTTPQTKPNENDFEKLKIKIDLTTNRIKRNDNIETRPIDMESKPLIDCDICHQKFQTEKTLKLHLQTKHIPSTYVYQCPSCIQTFLHPSAVMRHLSNDHKKSNRRIRFMRDTIHKRRIRLDEIQVKGPSRELARLQTDKDRRDTDQKVWLENIERSPTNSPFCTYCGKKFERKAVLTTHLNNCSVKNRQTPTLASASSSAVISSKKSVEPIQNPSTISPTISSTNDISAFVKIEPISNINQDKVSNNSISLPFDAVGKIEKTKTIKCSETNDPKEKKTVNSLKLIRDPIKATLMVSKKRKRKEKKLETPKDISIKETLVESNQEHRKNAKLKIELKQGQESERESKKENTSALVIATKKAKFKSIKSTIPNSESNQKSLIYFCRICEKSFSAMSNLRRHISMFHYRRRKFGCKICSYRAFRKYDVSNHLNSVHLISGEKSFDMIVVCEEKSMKEDVDGDIIISENGVYNKEFQSQKNPSNSNKDEIKTKEIKISRKGRKPKIAKVITTANIESIPTTFSNDTNSNLLKLTRSSSNLSNSSNEDNNAPPKRPIRNRIKPVNKDFVYDLSSLLKKDMLYAERESILTARAHRRRNTVVLDDSSRESASTSTSNSNSPPNGDIENGKVNEKPPIKGSAQLMAQLAVSMFSACFKAPPELPAQRPLIPSILAQLRQYDNKNKNDTKSSCSIDNHMKKIKQIRRVSDDSIIRSLTKKRKIEIDYASLSDTTSSRLLRKVEMNINGNDLHEKTFDFIQFKNSLKSQQNGRDQSNEKSKISVKCPTEKEFQEYLIAYKLTDPVKKINIADAVSNVEMQENGSSHIESDNHQNKRITLLQRLEENKNKKLQESLLRTALEN